MPVQSGMTTVFQKWNFMNKRMSEKGLIILYSLIFVIVQWFLNVLQTTLGFRGIRRVLLKSVLLYNRLL